MRKHTPEIILEKDQVHEITVAELSRLERRRHLISCRISKLRKACGLPKEKVANEYHCLHCDWRWVSRRVHRDPNRCPWCATCNYFEEPAFPSVKWHSWEVKLKQSHARKDGPGIKEQIMARVSTLPPPPKSLREQLVERVKIHDEPQPEHSAVHQDT